MREGGERERGVEGTKATEIQHRPPFHILDAEGITANACMGSRHWIFSKEKRPTANVRCRKNSTATVRPA